MFLQLFNKLFPKKSSNKRGISPVIATILLIALTVTAAAIVYFVVVPMFKGKGQLVQLSSLSLTDSNGDGLYDTASTSLMNIGTGSVTIDDSATVVIYSTSSASAMNHGLYPPTLYLNEERITWDVTSEREFTTQDEKTTVIESTGNETQISPLSDYEIIISFGNQDLSTGRQFSGFTDGGSSGDGDNSTGDQYLSSPLVYRTSSDDPSTSRSSFPASAGYSPRLWFIIGVFEDGESGLSGNSEDYISLNGHGIAEDYRPYIGLEDEFTDGDISSDTGYSILAYNDSGNYPGCVTFAGSTFDGGDDLNWGQRGIIYMFSYIYNPTDDAMDVSFSTQSDDNFDIWINGEFKDSGQYNDLGGKGWKTWREEKTVTLNPGYNIITLRTVDIGGNWDAQVLFWDSGATNDLTLLENAWPLTEPTSTEW
ncbi:MAG: archaellin/type IV pilin N-terminal domain-containing protein [Asgard group archaeon]|nr:archaellin/type IV pilin N-terminal domain-containing protein [Asgard group archaeon]